MIKQAGFFDVEERLARLSGLGDQLEVFSRTVDFEVFRPELEKALAYSDGSKGGRPPFDPVLMFRILVIQTLNNLSDERTEYLINDHLSFMRFLGLGLSDRVPDAKTLWLFRERLTQAGAVERLFDRFDAILRNAGYLPMSGQILDATLVAAPKQRNTNAEKNDLREGLLDKTNTASSVWADTAYRSKANEDFMEKQGFVSKVHRKKPHLKPMPLHIQKSNAGKSVVRSRVEHVFADQKSQTRDCSSEPSVSPGPP